MSEIQDKLSFRITKPNGMDEESFAHVIERYEVELGLGIVRKMKDGEVYTLRIRREYIPPTTQGTEYALYVDAYVGKVKKVEMHWKPEPKLTFWQRISVLFSGEYPRTLK